MKINAGQHLLVKFAGNTIRFDCDQVDLRKAIGTHFENCIGQEGQVVADYQVTTVDEVEFSISRDGSVLISKLSFEEVLFWLMQDGLMQLNGASTTELVFHAAAAAYQDRGVLLCGNSGSGKSTLTAWLVANGFQYLTDEVISYPLEGGEVSGFCRSLVLKKGAEFVLERWQPKADSVAFIKFQDGSRWVVPTLLNQSAVRAKVQPYLAVFLTYVAGSEFQVERLTSADTLFHLLQVLVNARNFPGYGMQATKRFASQVRAYTLTYSDIEQATEWIHTTITT